MCRRCIYSVIYKLAMIITMKVSISRVDPQVDYGEWEELSSDQIRILSWEYIT